MESRDAAIIRGTLGLASEGITGDIADMGTAEEADPFDEGIVIHEAASLPYGGDWTGKAAEGGSAGVELFDVGDGHVITRQTALLSAPGTGETLPVQMVEVYKLVNGKIADIDVYYKDTKAMSDFFGSASD